VVVGVGVAAFGVAVPASVGVLLDGSMEDIDPVMKIVFELKRGTEEDFESERGFGPPFTAVGEGEGFAAVGEVTGATEIFCANPTIELAIFSPSFVQGIFTNSVLIDVKNSVNVL
jgi:hypothetical protein